MTKLNDLQSILLSTAAQRDSGSLYPVPEIVDGAGARVTKAVAGLTKTCLAEERETSDPGAISRTDGDLRYGVYITAAGCAAIQIGEPGQAEAPASVSGPIPRTSKAGTVLALLQRDSGATLPELIEATGWLPHTTRAALTGLRKKGHAITRGKRNEVTCYTITVAAVA